MKVKLGIFTYEIIFRHQSDEEFGKTSLTDKKIWINTRWSLEVQRETLIHELLHVSVDDCSLIEHPIEKKDEHEEYLVRYISPRMFQMLNDNNKLRKFIFG